MRRSIELACVLLLVVAGTAAAEQPSPAGEQPSPAGETATPAPESDEEPAAATAPHDEAAAQQTAPDANGEGADKTDDDYANARDADAADLKFAWQTAGRHYVVPLAFFSIHGYLEGVWASASNEWSESDPTQLPMPGQLLVPNTAENAFQYDAAIFISTDTSAHTRSLLELHLVSNPSGQGTAGPGGLTIAITEASVSWDLYKTYLTLGGGLYWAPFGIVNIDWLGGQTLFQLVPRASAAFPSHFNERGVRINGSKAFNDDWGANYVLSLGNGVHAFDLSGQRSFDDDSDKTFISRFGLFPGLGKNLEVGYSFAAGELREDGDDTLAMTDPMRFPAKFVAHGADLTWKLNDLGLRSYYIHSKEHLDPLATGDPNPRDLTRQGFMFEASYHLWTDLPIGKVRAIVPKARVDWISVDTLDGDEMNSRQYQTAVYSAGVDIKSSGTVGAVLSLEYHYQDELRGQGQLDNNRLVARLLAKF